MLKTNILGSNKIDVHYVNFTLLQLLLWMLLICTDSLEINTFTKMNCKYGFLEEYVAIKFTDFLYKKVVMLLTSIGINIREKTNA